MNGVLSNSRYQEVGICDSKERRWQMKSTSANRTVFIEPECTARRWIAPKCTVRRRILIAGMGTSPAVRAETVAKLRVNLIYFAVETNQ